MINVSKDTAISMIASLNHLKNQTEWIQFMVKFCDELKDENPYILQLICANFKEKTDGEKDCMVFGAFLAYFAIKRELEAKELDELFA